MIAASAIKLDDKIYMGRRHGDIIGDQYPKGNKEIGRCGRAIQGFVTGEGEFLNRQEAGKHAFECGQTEEYKQTLYSEDLW